MATFSIQQNTAAEELTRDYREKGIRYAILISQCQAGKTGAYQRAIQLMFENCSITHAYIVCGSSELQLRQQAEDDTKEHNAVYYRERGYVRGENEQTIQVYFHQDFKTAELDIKNALIVVDESHLVQQVKQELSKFLAKYRITMDGNSATLDANNTYIMSVDATPYSEVAAIRHEETPYAKIQQVLIPGTGYVGNVHHYYAGRIIPSFSLATHEGRERFVTQMHSRMNMYALMRLNTSRVNTETEIHLRDLATLHGWDVLLYTSVARDIAITRKEQAELNAATPYRVIPCLEDEPTCPTIVIVRGCLRAGKVIPKYYVNFVWEGAKSSKTDAVIQGLLGRMCGYRNADGEHNIKKFRTDYTPLIFVPESFLARNEKKVIKLSELQRALFSPELTPMKATCLSRGTVPNAASNGKTLCPPIRLNWPDVRRDDRDPDWVPWNNPDADTAVLKSECMRLLEQPESLAFISNHPKMTEAQKSEILATIAIHRDADVHIRRGEGVRQENYYKNLIYAHKTHTCTTEHVADTPPITFFISFSGFSGLRQPHAHVRHLYVVFYTNASTGLDVYESVNLAARHPKTTKSCMYRLNAVGAEAIVAGGVIGLTAQHMETSAAFEAGIREYISLWANSRLTISSSLSAISAIKKRGDFTMRKTRFNWTAQRENDVERICSRLAGEFNITFTPIVYGSNAFSTNFSVKTISWQRN